MIFEVVQIIATVLLIAAVIALFAMMGELSAQVQGSSSGHVDSTLQPMADVDLIRPPSWPRELASVANKPVGHLIVLSTACQTCRGIAQDMKKLLTVNKTSNFAVLISTVDSRRAEDFIQDTQLPPGIPRYIDVGGAWIASSFGLNISPSLLTFEHGQLSYAHGFTSISALLQELPGKEEPHAQIIRSES